MLTFNAAQAIAELNAISLRLKFPATVLSLIGAQAAQRVAERIERSKTGPDGHGWPGWADSTSRSRHRRGTADRGLLYDDGTLLHSIRVQTDAHEVSIGTDVAFAGYLQDGTHRMPAREFLGWEEADYASAELTMLAYIEGLS